MIAQITNSLNQYITAVRTGVLKNPVTIRKMIWSDLLINDALVFVSDEELDFWNKAQTDLIAIQQRKKELAKMERYEEIATLRAEAALLIKKTASIIERSHFKSNNWLSCTESGAIVYTNTHLIKRLIKIDF